MCNYLLLKVGLAESFPESSYSIVVQLFNVTVVSTSLFLKLRLSYLTITLV